MANNKKKTQKALTHDEIVAKWKKSNATATKELDYNQYISQRGLAIIRECEGHHDGYDEKKKTTYYGLQQNGIDGLERLSTRFGVKVPDWMVGARADKVTEEQAKEITGYIGMLNTMLVDNFTGCDNFSKMDIETRTPFLIYLHNESPYKLRKSMEKKKPGSFLGAVKTNNPYLMAHAMLSKGDGSSIGEAYDPLSNAGYIRRLCITLSALGDKNFTFNVQEERDLDIKLRQKDYIAESRARLKALSDDFFHTREAIDASNGELPVVKQPEQQIASAKPVEQVQQPEAQPAAQEPAMQPKQQQNNAQGKVNLPIPSVLTEGDIAEANNVLDNVKSAFTAFSKNLFTNNSEDNNNATGNQNVNMQQSVASTGRGTDRSV